MILGGLSRNFKIVSLSSYLNAGKFQLLLARILSLSSYLNAGKLQLLLSNLFVGKLSQFVVVEKLNGV